MNPDRKNSRRYSVIGRPALLGLGLCIFVLALGCTRIDRLETTVATHDEQITTLRQDVDELQGGARPGAASPVTGPATSSPKAKADYQRGRSLYLRGDYEAAAEVFRGILAQYPTDRYAPNAGYWLGECYYSRAKYREAIGEFEKTAASYPSSHKASDSMLKVAFSYHHLGEGPTAMTVLRDLLARYPQSNAAVTVKSGRTVFGAP